MQIDRLRFKFIGEKFKTISKSPFSDEGYDRIRYHIVELDEAARKKKVRRKLKKKYSSVVTIKDILFK